MQWHAVASKASTPPLEGEKILCMQVCLFPMTNGGLSVQCILYLVMAFQNPQELMVETGTSHPLSWLNSLSGKFSFPEMSVGLLVASRRGIVFQTFLAPQEGQFYRTFFSETISCLLSECQVCICQNAHWQTALWLRELFSVHNKVAVIWKTQRLSSFARRSGGSRAVSSSVFIKAGFQLPPPPHYSHNVSRFRMCFQKDVWVRANFRLWLIKETCWEPVLIRCLVRVSPFPHLEWSELEWPVSPLYLTQRLYVSV